MSNAQLADKAAEIIGDLQGFVPDDRMVIAGGFPRDVILGRDAKDLDFIINTNGMDPAATTALNEWWHLQGLTRLSGQKAYSAQASGNTFMVYGDKKGKHPAQFIVTKVPPLEFVAETFDFGFCQIAYGMDGLLFKSQAFDWDADNKKISLLIRDTITPYQLGYAVRDHFPRLKHKYPWDMEILWLTKQQAKSYCKMRIVK